ncbi:hypothetical protein BGX38DRAFT_1145592 [Terfezia claveryi]|nr:hypothetical protein BGX38DRAFT_1145592 [Terfezia claveryi]
MVKFAFVALVAVSFLAQLASAIPAPEALINPPLVVNKPTPTTCTTESNSCYSICTTPTTTLLPTHCPKIGISTSCVDGAVPMVTVLGKCRPDPCPLDIKTVAVACPTNPPFI